MIMLDAFGWLRLRTLGLIFLCLLLLFSGSPRLEAADGPIKIGLLAPVTGPVAANGQEMLNGWNLYWDDQGREVAGREVQVLHEDSSCKPSVALNKARSLVEQRGVHMLVGPLCSHAGLAVSDYLRKQEDPIPFFLPIVGADNITQRNRAPNEIRVAGWSSSQTTHPLGEWVAQSPKYGTKAMTLAADFAFGHESVGGFVNTFTDHGGEIVGQLWNPIGTSDYSSYIANVISEQPDVVFSEQSGADAVRFVKQWNEFGLKGRIPLLGNITMFDQGALRSMPPDAALGLLSSGNFAEGRQQAATRSFVEFYDATYGQLPAQYAAAMNTAAKWLARAMEDVGGNVENKQAFLRAVRNVKFEQSALGPIRLDRYDNPIQNIYLRKVTQRDDGRLWNVPIHTWESVSQFWTYDPGTFMEQPVYSREYQGKNWP